MNSSSAAFCFRPFRLLLSARYCFQSGLLVARSLIWVMQRPIRKSQCLGPEPYLLRMLMHWEIYQTCSFTLRSICGVVKPPLPCQISMVSPALLLTPTPEFSAQMLTWWVRIWIELSSATTDFWNQQASYYIQSSQQWSIIKWWISNAC